MIKNLALPLSWQGFLVESITMDKSIRRYIIAIALSNLIESITISLEGNEICPNNENNEEDVEYLEFLAASALTILKEIADIDPNLPISKPKWDELTKR